MKKYACIISVFIFLSSFNSKAQVAKDSVKLWSTGGIMNLAFSQVSLSNWVAGGENSSSLNALVKLFANYKKNKMALDNNLDLAYGLTKKGSDPYFKNDDRIDFASKLGYVLDEKWYSTFLFNFKTQFYEGKKTAKDSVRISNFMAPAYLLASLGLDYKPSKIFSLFISLATGRVTIVNDTKLADDGAFGVDKAILDTSGKVITHGKKIRYEFGSYMKIVIDKDIMKNVNLQSKLELFSNYNQEPQNLVINWDFLLNMKINKFLSATINTLLIYDPKAKVSAINALGKQEMIGPRTQFKELVGLGLSYKF